MNSMRCLVRRLAAVAVLVLTVSNAAIGGAAVLLSGSEASTSAQSIPVDALDFFTFNAGGTKNEKVGGPIDWTFSSGALTDGISNQNISWTNGTPVAAATNNRTWYLPFGPGYGANQVSSGWLSFTLSDSAPATLTLFTRPNGNGSSLTYDMEVLIDGVPQFSQGGVTDSNSADLQILTFELSGYSAGDVVDFVVSNVSGPNNFRNFAFLGGSVSIVPEPSTWVMGLAGLACAAWGAVRRRKRT